MTIPQIRVRLLHLADQLAAKAHQHDDMDLTFYADALTQYVAQLHRRKARTHGRTTSRPIREAAGDVIALYRANPDANQHEIGAAVGVNPGRVSELIAGKRA